MRRLFRAALATLAAVLLCGADGAALDDAAARYFAGDLAGAEAAYSALVEGLNDEDGPALRYELLTSLAAVRAELGHFDRALVPLTEALAVADVLAAEGTFPDAPIACRLQLAETLFAGGRHADAEAAGWDLLDHAVAKGDLALTIFPVRIILLSALETGATEPQLADLMAEWDVALGGLEAYRLAVPPPPEPIVVGLEAMARDFAARGSFAEAAALFKAITTLDEARGADWRLAQDHSQVAFVALQAGDLDAAEAALDRATALQGDAVGADVLASRAALAYERGDREGAATLTKEALAVADAQGDRFRTAALRGRLGRLRGTPADHTMAAAIYEELGAVGEAAQERALAALAGPPEKARDAYAEAVAKLGEDVPVPPGVAEIGLLIDHRALAGGAVADGDFDAVLAAVQKGWFDLEEPERLMAAVLLQFERNLGAEPAADDDTDADVASVEALQAQVGLELEGWYAAYARGLAAASGTAVRIEAWTDAARRLEWTMRHPLRGTPAPGEPPLPEPPAPDVHEALLRELVAADRYADAVALVEHVAAIEEQPPSPKLDADRKLMRAVSFRGGERHPEEVRAEIRRRVEMQMLIYEAPEAWTPPEGTVGLRAILLADHVHLVLVTADGARKLNTPSVDWLERVLPHRPKTKRQRRKPDARWMEVGHLFGGTYEVLKAADTIRWVPAGPFVGVPLEEVPLGGTTIGELATVVTATSLAGD